MTSCILGGRHAQTLSLRRYDFGGGSCGSVSGFVGTKGVAKGPWLWRVLDVIDGEETTRVTWSSPGPLDLQSSGLPT